MPPPPPSPMPPPPTPPPTPPPPSPKPPCATPIDFVLVLDESGSMRGSMDGLKSFAKRLVDNYAPGPSAARFSVVSFQSVATTRVGWSTNRVDIDAAIDQMEADGA